MFRRTESGIWRVTAFDALPWLEHGFGSRHAGSPSGNLATLRQVQSDIVVMASGECGRIGEGDALITDHPGWRIGVRTADCLPILLVDEQRRAAAAVHAGWRGSILGIAVRTVEAMARCFGSRPESLSAAIGPGINMCCFEVGPEVALQFRKLFPERNDLEGRTRIDLVEANRRQLVLAGLDPQRIFSGAPCTCCTPAEFHSWRRDREPAARMVSWIEILP